MKNDNDLWFLHVSDLHISDPEQDIFLRKGHYKDLVGGLVTKVLATITSDRLSGMIFSGDIVDKGGIDNLPHGRVVLDHLRKELHLDNDQVIGIHGNHDFKWDEVARKSYADAIGPAVNVFRDYGHQIDGCQLPLGVLHGIAPGVFVLTLDSMLDAPVTRPGNPGNPAIGPIDDVVEMVRDNVKMTEALIVVSHHSLSSFHVIHDVKEKLWEAGLPLAERLSKLRGDSGGAMIWLSSDLHIPAKPYPLFSFTCLPGSHLDGRSTQTVQKPGVVLFCVKVGSSSGTSVVVELVQATHKPQYSGGEWQLRESHSFPATNHSIASPSGLTKGKRVELRTKQKSAVPKGKAASVSVIERGIVIERFSDSITPVTGGAPSLEQQIIDTVARENLYHLGRFETAASQVSLGWVSIGPLMAGTPQGAHAFSSSTPLLPQVISQMRGWLVKKAEDLGIRRDPASVVLLGIDCWGAVISSQLSVMTGWRNFCIAGRGKGVHHTTFERITRRVVREIDAASLVVFITDVIASGSTLCYIKDEITRKTVECLGNKRRKIKRKWIAAGILCDEITVRGDAFRFVKSIGCACKSLRIPLIDLAQLPDRQILPARLRFTYSDPVGEPAMPRNVKPAKDSNARKGSLRRS